MNELKKYEAAKYALAEAKAVDEVKHIHDVSAAMKAYARQAKDKQMEIDASEIRIRAERRLGEMIQEQKETVGLNEGRAGAGRPSLGGATEEPPKDPRPTLAQAGIDKKLSARSQKLASIPEAQFESTLAEHREQQQAVTAKTMEKLSKQGEEIKHKETHPVSLAHQYASMAIMQLERITKTDPNAIKELERVQKWIAETKRRMK